MKKSFILPVLALIALAASAVSLVQNNPVRTTTSPRVAPAQAAFEQFVAAVGVVEANTENISLSAPLPGVVERVHVEVGQDVLAGTPLVKLDTRALEAALAARRSERLAQAAAVQTAEALAHRSRTALKDVQRQLKFAEAVSDPRSISAEELTRRRSAVESAEAEVKAAEAGVVAAQAGVATAEAAIKTVETDLKRCTVTAPVAGRILQVRIRPGEYASAGAAHPWMVMGGVTPLHVRVDVDEHEAWRVQSNAAAIAHVRGKASLRCTARFVRFEPMVVPKQSLTGGSAERVDTRVLQVIYRIDDSSLPLYVGQQMDVFIDASPLKTAAVRP